ncbi:MAG: hypothetical protein PWQ28_440 [Candidatus Woesearchaeota archaeon]|nr:hypothetical protein [Candidatus Woesearchaeota archaeon]MDK2907761.1 hypothetical protein [Candidatus Woesearchaeota archaeon]
MMTEKKEGGPVKNYKQRDIDIAYEFSKRAYKEFGDFIKSIVIFGSRARKTENQKSDLDILIIVDDVSYVITPELSESYKRIMNTIINEVSENIHATTLKLSSVWDYLMKSDPIIINILREGLAILDSGVFEPLQMLLYSGKIRPSKESIYGFIERAPLALTSSKNRILQALQDIYWACIDSAHAALMSLGYLPPVPSKVVDYMRKAKEFSEEDILLVERVMSLYKKLKVNELKKFTGAELDSLMEDTEAFIQRMSVIIDKNLKS